MKKLFFLTAILFSGFAFSQVGVNTPTPEATFDVTAKNATGTSANVDGFLVPRIDRERAQVMTSIPISTLIFINDISRGNQTGTTINVDSTGYYYFDGNVWIKLNSGSASDINIYNSDGNLTGNRIVEQAANTLAFTTNSVNGFSVDGKTFTVDSRNNRVGFGTTTPSTKFEIVSDNEGNFEGNNFYFKGIGSSKEPSLILGSANGTAAAPTNLVAGNYIGSLYFAPRANNTFNTATGSSISSFYRGDGINTLGDLVLRTSNKSRVYINENGNVGINTDIPNSSAMLEVSATDKGFLPPRLTTAQRDAINPKPAGLMVYNASQQEMQYWNGSSWIKFAYQ